MTKRKLSAACVAILISGCAVEPILITPPIMPKIITQELECLTDGVYSRLRERENLHMKYRGQLEALIK